LKQQEICQIFAGDKQSFAVTRQGRIFCWGSNENHLLGLGLEESNDAYGEDEEKKAGEDIHFEPKELKMETLNSAFSEKEDGKKSEKNPFKKGKTGHEGFQSRTLIVDHYKNNLCIYSSSRVV